MGQLVRAVRASRRSTELFKTLSRVTVRMNPYDHRSTTAREFVRRVRAPPVKKVNPRLAVAVELVEEYGTPSIELVYSDGLEQKITSGGMKVQEIMEQVERVARWRGAQAQNPFKELRERRARELGLAGLQ